MHIDLGISGLALTFLTILVSTNYETAKELTFWVLDNGLKIFYKFSK